MGFCLGVFTITMRPTIPMAIAIPEARSAMVESSSLPQTMDEAAFLDFYEETAPKLWSFIRRAMRP